MPISGGADLSDLIPLNSQGNLHDESEGTLGCHTGNAEWLNIRNAQPGFYYFYQRRNRSDIRRSYLKGAEVVPPEAPESMGDLVDPRIAQALDGVPGSHDVVLMRMPLEKRREDLAARDSAAHYQLHGADKEFVDKESAQEAYYSQQKGIPIRYRRRDHRVYTDDI